MREDLIYGIHAIQHLLNSKPEQFLELHIQDTHDNKSLLSLASLAKTLGVNVSGVSKKQLDQWLPERNHQGVAAKVRLQPLLTEDDFSTLIDACDKPPLFLILDGVQDPHNLGACLRTADAVGVTAVIIPKDRSASLTPVVRKVASGAAETVPVVQVTNLVRAIEMLKKLGVWIMGTSMQTTQSLYQVDLKGSVAIVLGAEGTGLRRLTEEHCDVLMQIPMMGVVESLNVSVAAGVCLYEATRQRLNKVD
ncbi:MAG TPA: 23S rRNA (guanosine(2251)-2'-O)-methyltransferase RlmB [Gammaproteobacteria bacterium]|nr:23S rRNA (guanosine(2251)-2'-O)-methyltransferase RlmB [Gammaproteobacteria bacterium]HQZ87666.1 23S rRNA (guanosine(2251)-2'-O)-methyltransferase RlmB [Gammaproteobacteria bacterium]HRA42970.1 23S rRNA (guanosine(2251)-2'-O)-methyltransferase RlmB [Gammaproteobacteria bacterium]